jgi:hypothetical protein
VRQVFVLVREEPENFLDWHREAVG